MTMPEPLSGGVRVERAVAGVDLPVGRRRSPVAVAAHDGNVGTVGGGAAGDGAPAGDMTLLRALPLQVFGLRRARGRAVPLRDERGRLRRGSMGDVHSAAGGHSSLREAAGTPFSLSALAVQTSTRADL